MKRINEEPEEYLKRRYGEKGGQTQRRERAPLGDRFGVQTQSRKAVFSLQSLEVCKQYIEQRHAETEF